MPNLDLMMDALNAIQPFLKTMTHDEAICFFGTAVDAFCAYHQDSKPDEILHTLTELSAQVNESEGAFRIA